MKKAMIGIDKLMILILVVLTVLAVLMFVFKADINSYIKNLPGYSVPEDEVIDISELPEDQQIYFDCVQIGKIENNFVYLKEDLESDQAFLTFVEIDGVRLDVGRDNIGYIDGTEIFLRPGLSENKLIYYDLPRLPTFWELELIENSRILAGNLLCVSSNDLEELNFKHEEEINLLRGVSSSSLINLILGYGIDDKISLGWNFVDNKPIIVLMPNKKTLPPEANNGIIYSADEFDEIRDGGYLSKIDEKDLIKIRDLASSRSPQQFSEVLKGLLEEDNGRAKYYLESPDGDSSLYGPELNEINQEKLNIILYGVEDVSSFEARKENNIGTQLGEFSLS